MGLAGVVAVAATLALGAGAHPVVFGTEASNKRLAEREATAELRSLGVPPGARRVGQAPARYLEEPMGTSGDPNEIDRWKWLMAPGTVKETFRWFRAHPPANSHVELEGRGSHEMRSIWFAVREHSRRVGGPSVIETAARLPGHKVGILIEVRQDWKTPHPAAAKVPAAARIIDVSRTIAGRTRWQEIREPGRVRRIAHVIDQLPAAQPEINYGCGVVPSTVTHTKVRIRFKARKGGPVLAEAAQRVPLGACESMRFTVAGDPHTFEFDGGTRAIELLRR
jgi:hypothetical protein